MEIYTVGGAVRDELLGLPVHERDYVVVGATPEDLLKLGYRPVGKDFPVFINPRTQEEYALARTERKTAPGYHGFIFHADPSVTLEEDLARRDLTINAIAKDEHGNLTDPWHGRADIQARVLRHVSPAFAEDPVRILRVARFAARFADFSIAPETLVLMRRMVENGEVDHLVSERVWQELAKGLNEDAPSRMFLCLRECGALARILPEVDALFGVPQRSDFHPEVDAGVHTMMVLDIAASISKSQPNRLALRFAALTHDIGKGVTPSHVLPRHTGHEEQGMALLGPLCERLRVPSECRDLALLVAGFHDGIHRIDELRPETVVKMIERCDGLRRPERFIHILQACEADYRGRKGSTERSYPQADRWRAALVAMQSVDAGAIAKSCATPEKIPIRIHEARVAAVKQKFAGSIPPALE